MSAEEKNKALYTVIYNNTKENMVLRVGKHAQYLVEPDKCIVVDGYVLQTSDKGEYNMIVRNIAEGNITALLAVKTVIGSYNFIELHPEINRGSLVLPDKSEPAVAAAVKAVSKTAETKSESKLPETPSPEPSRMSVVGDAVTSDPNKNVVRVGLNLAEPYTQRMSDDSDRSFNVRAPVDQRAISFFGAKATEEQPYAKAAAKEAEQRQEEAEAKAAKVEDSMARLEADITALYETRDWIELLDLLRATWPDIEFNKRSVIGLKTFAGLVKKYKLTSPVAK